MRFLGQLAICILTFIFSTTALYEDQAGKFDWFKQYLGNVDNYFIEKQNAPSRRIIISSNNNVHSAVNLISGKIEWRQSLREEEKVIAIDYCKNYLITLTQSENDVLLKVWDTIIGVIMWEKEMSDKDILRSAIKCKETSESFIINVNDMLQSYYTKSGALIWDNKIENFSNKFYNIEINYLKNCDKFVVLSKNALNHEFLIYNNNGKFIDSFNENHLLKCSISKNNILYCLDVDKFHVFYRNVNNGDSNWKSYQIPSPLEIDDNEIYDFKILNANSLIILIRNNTKSENSLTGFVYGIPTNSDNLNLVHSLENRQVIKTVELDNENYLVSLRQSDAKIHNLKVEFYELTSRKSISYLTNLYTLNLHHGFVINMDLILFKKKDNNLSFRLFLITQDHALHFWNQNGNIFWMREESLANVAAVEMLDLPVSDTEAKMDEEFGHNKDNVFQKFVKRITTQLSQLKDFLQEQIKQSRNSNRFSYDDDNKDKSCSSEQNDDCKQSNDATGSFADYYTNNDNSSQYNLGTTLRRDSFNLHKMLVLATTSGKIFGMESSTGRIVWRYLIPNTKPFGRNRVLLFIQRTTAHFPHPPEAVLLMQDKLSDYPILHTFNPITGLPRGSTQKLNYHMYLAAMLSLPVTEENSYNKPLLILDKDLKIHIYPNTFQLSLNSHPLYLYRVDDTKGYMIGYEIVRTDETAQCKNSDSTNDQDCYVARQNWQLYFGANSQKISAVAFKSSIEQVHSVGRILSDRNVLYKYLNPNLLALITESNDINNPIVTVYLIDVVTGKIIYSTIHKKASGPINLVQSENWIVYSFQNLKSHRSEIAVLELYEPYEIPESILSEIKDTDINQLRRNSRLASSNKNGASSQTNQNDFGGGFDILSILSGERATTKKFSSKQRSRIESKADNHDDTINTLGPIVLKQSYIMSTFIRRAAVSVTEKGITSKSVLLALESGGILELPKAQLDPRRSLVMNQELLEEGVEPYIPEIQIRTTSIINYNQSLARVANIYAGPSGLESTSLVFVYGLDLFFTQIAPSKMFDVLKEDFDHWFIGTVMVGMILAAFITQKLAARKALYRAWQ